MLLLLTAKARSFLSTPQQTSELFQAVNRPQEADNELVSIGNA